MELSLSHTLHLFHIFRKYDEKENCAQVLEEEIYKMFCTKSLNDEHDCNVVSMNSLSTHDAMICKATSLGMLCLMRMIFLLPQVLMRKYIMIIAGLLSMMIIVMRVDLEEC